MSKSWNEKDSSSTCHLHCDFLDVLFWEANKIHMVAYHRKKINKIDTNRYFAVSIISLNQFRAAATPFAQERMYFPASPFFLALLNCEY